MENIIKLKEQKELLKNQLEELYAKLTEYDDDPDLKNEFDDLQFIPGDGDDDEEHSDNKYVIKHVEATQLATGITYTNIKKNWQTNDIWKYIADVSIKVIDFKVELTVDKKDKKNTKIIDVTCHFANVESSYLQEIIPWVKDFTTKKEFSPLMAAFSVYGNAALTRSKILNKCETKNFVTIEHTEQDGGLIALIHSPKSIDEPLASINWKTLFNDKSRRIEHSFSVNVIDEDFGTKNRQLFQDLCKKGLKKDELETIWSDLCAAIKEYK